MDSTEAVYYVEETQLRRRSVDANGNDVVSVLNIPGPFDLVCVNSLDTLLAVYGDQKLQIWALNGASNNPRIIYTDETMFDKSSLAKTPLQIGFHPYARYDGGLIVLTGDRIVSIYCPFGVDPVVDVLPIEFPGSVPCSITNFCFGSSDTLNGGFNLYLANADHDIYRLSPLIPPEIEIPVRNYADLGSESSAIDKCIECGSSWRKRLGKTRVYKRSPLYKLPQFDDEDSLAIAPFPAELYEEDLIDMKSGSLGWNTDFIVVLTTHFVNFLVLPPDSADSLTLLLSLDCFSSDSSNSPNSTDSINSDNESRKISLISQSLLFIASKCDTMVLDIANLRLSQYWANDCAIKSITKQLIPRSHIYTNHGDIVAFSGSHINRFQDTPGSSINSSINDSNDSSIDNSVDNSVDNSIETSLSSSNESSNEASSSSSTSLESKLPQSICSTNIDFKSLQFDRPFIPSALNANLQSVIDLHLVDKSVQEWYIKFLSSAKQQETNLQLLKMVSSTQETVLADLGSKITPILEKYGMFKAKADEILERQRNLAQRFDSLQPGIHKLELSSEQPLSSAEKAWFNELQTVSQKSSKLEDKMQSISTTLSNPETPQQPSNLTTGQLRYLLNKLKIQETLIDDLRGKCGEISS